MSVTERYPTLPGTVPTNVTRYPPLRGNGNGAVRGGHRGEKRYRGVKPVQGYET